MSKEKAVAETTPVNMDDDRVVEFGAKAKLKKEIIIDDGVIKIRLDFRNGETRLFTVPPVLVNQFAAHGASQKLGDAIAGIDKIEDAILSVDTLMDAFNAGKWSTGREASGTSVAGSSVLARALIEVSGKSAADVRAMLAGLDAKQKAALKLSDKLRPVAARIEAEDAAKKAEKSGVDTAGLLASFGL